MLTGEALWAGGSQASKIALLTREPSVLTHESVGHRSHGNHSDWFLSSAPEDKHSQEFVEEGSPDNAWAEAAGSEHRPTVTSKASLSILPCASGGQNHC